MMPTIVDHNGNDWVIRLTIGDAREVLAYMGIDLFEISDDGGFPRIITDPAAMGDLIGHLIVSQQQYRGLSDRKVARLLRGLHEQCIYALQLAYQEFMPVPQESSDAESKAATSSDWWDALHEAESTIGYRCDHMSMRQLLATAKAISTERWRHTATITAMVLNAQRRFVRRPLSADDLLRSSNTERETVDGKWFQRALGVSKN